VTFSLAFMASPALSTGLISAGFAAGWIGLLCAGCLGTALLGLRLGGQLTPEQDGASLGKTIWTGLACPRAADTRVAV